MTTPWRGHNQMFTRRNPDAPARPAHGNFVALTGDTQPLVRVGKGELTCVQCGETFGVSRPVTGESTQCWRCGCKKGVLTISYLQSDEYMEVR